MRAAIIGDTPQQELDRLWAINYKQHLLPLLNSTNEAALVWTEQEDLLILHFYFNQHARR